MKGRSIAVVAITLPLVVAVGVLIVRRPSVPVHFTGFVEGEERLIRSEVAGRVVEVHFAEGDTVPPGAIIARLDDADVQASVATKREEMEVLAAEIVGQVEQVRLTQNLWHRDVAARQAEVREAEATSDLADKTYRREVELVKMGFSAAQSLDTVRSRMGQAGSMLDRAQAMSARATAEEGTITVAERLLDVLHQRRSLVEKQLAQLEITVAKYQIRAPNVATSVQTQYIWPAELAQSGSLMLGLLDPSDKYVQIYVSVADLPSVAIGQPVAIELDSVPGRRFAGEVAFVADKASFTPEKIETRSDRLGQVYRAKVRILDGAEAMQPGTEGNVYLVNEHDRPAHAANVPGDDAGPEAPHT